MFERILKKKDDYAEKHGLMGNADDYHIYHMRLIDYLVGFLIGFALGFVVVMIFFRVVIFAVTVGAVCGIPAIKYYRKYRKEKRQRDLLIEFRDLLEALTTSYSSGKNTMEAFAESYQDLLSLYGEKSDIVNETRIIIAGMTNNIIIEDLLRDFAERCGLEDVESFTSTFESGLRQGGDIRQV
ncbi:MAG: type II secretion system F family protein, partial [Lachnoanaerobaculum saburreum]